MQACNSSFETFFKITKIANIEIEVCLLSCWPHTIAGTACWGYVYRFYLNLERQDVVVCNTIIIYLNRNS